MSGRYGGAHTRPAQIADLVKQQADAGLDGVALTWKLEWTRSEDPVDLHRLAAQHPDALGMQRALLGIAETSDPLREV